MENLSVKVEFNGEKRRFLLQSEVSKFSDLQNKVKKVFALEEQFVMKYIDDEGDLITMSTDSDVETATHLCPELLRIKVQKTTTTSSVKPQKVNEVEVSSSESESGSDTESESASENENCENENEKEHCESGGVAEIPMIQPKKPLQIKKTRFWLKNQKEVELDLDAEKLNDLGLGKLNDCELQEKLKSWKLKDLVLVGLLTTFQAIEICQANGIRPPQCCFKSLQHGPHHHPHHHPHPHVHSHHHPHPHPHHPHPHHPHPHHPHPHHPHPHHPHPHHHPAHSHPEHPHHHHHSETDPSFPPHNPPHHSHGPYHPPHHGAHVHPHPHPHPHPNHFHANHALQFKEGEGEWRRHRGGRRGRGCRWNKLFGQEENDKIWSRGENQNEENIEQDNFHSHPSCLFGRKRMIARFIQHVTLPQNSIVAAGSTIVKTWRVRNDSTQAWPQKCELVFSSGDNFNSPPTTEIRGDITAGSEADISITLVAPEKPGHYQGFWRLQEVGGRKFGERLWTGLIVEKSSDSEDFVEVESIDALEAKLQEMGFQNKNLNLALLQRFRGNIERVVDTLNSK